MRCRSFYTVVFAGWTVLFGGEERGRAWAASPKAISIDQAVEERNLPMVEAWLRETADPNTGSYLSDRTPLQRALETGFIAGARLIADRGGHCGNPGYCPIRPLIAACREPEARSLFALLLDKGVVSPNVRIEDGTKDTALDGAAQVGDAWVVARLLAKGADPNLANTNGFTPLMMAGGAEGPKVVAQLLAAGAALETTGMFAGPPLLEALCGNRREVALALIQAGAKVELSGEASRTPLGCAAEWGDVDMLKQLVGRGAKVGSQDNLALWKAAEKGRVSAARWLLANGASARGASEKQAGPLVAAGVNGSIPLVELLLAHGANPNDGLATAAGKGHGEVVALLLAKGARPAQVGEAAVKAAQRGDVGILDRLLAAGADPNARREFDQQTPLHTAAEGGYGDCVARLLAAGADLEAVEHYGKNTALMLAAKKGHLAVVKKLVAAGAQVDRKNDTDQAALDLAMDSDDDTHRAVVRHLRAHGAKGKGYVFGIRTPRFLWGAGVLAFAMAYMGTAIYLQEKTYHGRTEDNPFRWVSFGLFVGTGTTVSILAMQPFNGNDPTGTVSMARFMVLMVAGTSTVAYGIPALIFRNNRYAYYASAGLVATLPLLSWRF